MSHKGKANYEAYRDFAHGKSLVSGAVLPPWDSLPNGMQAGWNAGADAVEAWLAEAPADEDAPGNEPRPVTRYALVELMGHAQVTGSWRETVLCGRPMLEITRLDAAERRVQLVGPESVYRLTPLTEAEAMHVTRYARAALTAPTSVQDVEDDIASWDDDDDDDAVLAGQLADTDADL
jgi:hypothetical protein